MIDAEIRCPIEPGEEMLVVRRDHAAQMVGELALPEDAKRRPFTGVVVAVGPASDAAPSRMRYSPGDRVLYNRFADTVLEVGPAGKGRGDQLVLCNVRDIKARVDAGVEVRYVDGD